MEIASTYNVLQDELNNAKESLKGMDESIKRFLGRDPNEVVTPVSKTGLKRTAGNQLDNDPRSRPRTTLPPGRRRDAGGQDSREGPPPNKRRPNLGNVFSRLSGPVRSRRAVDSGGEEEEFSSRPSLQSQVIAPIGMVVSRQEVVAAQNPDEKCKARNRRMFGALLGTLQKFRQEETKMKDKEDKRAKVELKLEEAAKHEREQLRQEKFALFAERKRKQAEIKKIEYKLYRMKEQEEWEAKQLLLLNFIKTRSNPPIFYLPKSHTAHTLKLVSATKEFVERSIEQKRQELQEEMEQVERSNKAQQERERGEDGENARDQKGRRERNRERRSKGSWRENQKERSKSSRKREKSGSENAENRPEDDSDLENEAGPELDADGVGPGKEGEDDREGVVENTNGQVKGGEKKINSDEAIVDTNVDPENDKVNNDETNNTSSNVDEKEFEPVYD